MELYHYTSIETLEKILTNQTFRFTNMNSLNDKTEYAYGVDLLKNSIIDYEKRNNIQEHLDVALLDRFMFNGELYSVSFTEEKDSLIFWNSFYIEKNKSVSIGIEKNEIFDEKILINKCIYGNPYPIMGHNAYMLFYELFHNLTLFPKNKNFIHITFQTAHIKQKCFDVEREWRGVSFPQSEIKMLFRNGNGHKYFDYPINLKSIKRIVIGPSNTQKENADRVYKKISELKLNNIDIELSTIPLNL